MSSCLLTLYFIVTCCVCSLLRCLYNARLPGLEEDNACPFFPLNSFARFLFLFFSVFSSFPRAHEEPPMKIASYRARLLSLSPQHTTHTLASSWNGQARGGALIGRDRTRGVGRSHYSSSLTILRAVVFI
jgi:hypothetical protein